MSVHDSRTTPPRTADALLCCWVEQREELLRFCRRSLGRADGEEAFSRATLSMLRAAASTEGLSRPAAWLREIVRHACIDIHRERARRRRCLLLVGEDVGDLAAPAVAAARDPERVFLERERLTLLEGAVRALPPPLRAPLLLRARDDLSYAEIAALLFEPEENLRKRVQVARQAVRRSVVCREESTSPPRPAVRPRRAPAESRP